MGRLDVKIDDDLETRFRLQIVKSLGGKKGTLTQALEDAIDVWLKQESK